jgi:hypothetical protein
MHIQRYIATIAALLMVMPAGRSQKVDLSTPQAALETHFKNLELERPNLSKAASVIPERVERREACQLVEQVRDIYRGSGLIPNIALAPTDTNYRDSTKQHRYTLFPNDYPEIYLERFGNKWQYSMYSVQQIPIIYRKVYPTGSRKLLHWLPRLGFGQEVLGFHDWQFIGLAIFACIAFLFYLLLKSILYLIFEGLVRKRYGREFSELDQIEKIVRQVVWLLTLWLIQSYFPVLQFPPKVAYVVLKCLQIAAAVVLYYLLVEIIAFFVMGIL